MATSKQTSTTEPKETIMALDSETKSNIEDQISRQAAEKEAYTPAITLATDALAAVENEIAPFQAELDAIEARATELKQLIQDKQPALGAARYDLEVLNKNKNQLEDAIRGCELVLAAEAVK